MVISFETAVLLGGYPLLSPQLLSDMEPPLLTKKFEVIQIEVIERQITMVLEKYYIKHIH